MKRVYVITGEPKAREGDPTDAMSFWIPFPSAPPGLRPGMTDDHDSARRIG
jgi:hypothetical protein